MNIHQRSDMQRSDMQRSDMQRSDMQRSDMQRSDMQQSDMQQSDMQVVKSTDDARAGVTGQRVRYVLGFGLAGILLAFLVLGVYFGLGGH